MHYFCSFSILRTPRSTLFPYTTLFRSLLQDRHLFGHFLRILDEQFQNVDRVTLAEIALRLRQRHEDHRPVVFGHRSEEHTSELQSRRDLVCRLLLEKKKIKATYS